MSTSEDARENLKNKFRALKPILDNLLEEATFCLGKSELLTTVKLHSITGRVKDEESFLQKVERKSYSDPFGQTDDLVGIRVVCLFRDDLPSIEHALHVEFDILDSEDKTAAADPDSFGYMSHHYICTLKSTASGRRYEGLAGQRFEIQCRTLLMDAWANVSHYLAYKGEQSIPSALRKDFHALSGLLHVADTQFGLVYAGSQASRKAAVDALQDGRENASDEINLSNVEALFGELYPDRKHTDLQQVSVFVEELATAGILSFASLREMLQRGHDSAIEYERLNPPMIEKEFADVGIARHAVSASHSNFRRIKYGDTIRDLKDVSKGS